MTVIELKEQLDNYPEDMVVSIDSQPVLYKDGRILENEKVYLAVRQAYTYDGTKAFDYLQLN